MSTELNKQVAREFFRRFDAKDIAGALATMTDDATWWLAGRPEAIPTAGVKTKAQIARVFQAMMDQLKDGLRMEVTGAIAEGDQVALEVVSHGELHNGRIYRNQYHVLVTVRDGKISAVKEYLDTQHVVEVWFTPQT
ncbi:limonene-1,2-epoxide hydrolase [Burkholderiales bacterium]|nr:limonene-1,2-epoxide hydrolase [Burkholderiales bacterium]